MQPVGYFVWQSLKLLTSSQTATSRLLCSAAAFPCEEGRTAFCMSRARATGANGATRRLTAPLEDLCRGIADLLIAEFELPQAETDRRLDRRSLRRHFD